MRVLSNYETKSVKGGLALEIAVAVGASVTTTLLIGAVQGLMKDNFAFNIKNIPTSIYQTLVKEGPKAIIAPIISVCASALIAALRTTA